MQTPSREHLEVRQRVVIGVDASGTITAVVDERTAQSASLLGAAAEVFTAPDGAVLLPGLVDLHVHAPQWPQLGTGLDLPLEQWLATYTFPLEARYVDAEFAQRVWDDLVPTLLRHGTTTAVYYASTHLEATTRLASTCHAHGQRALVGRVAMDHPDHTPSWYRDASAVDGVAASHASIEAIRALDPHGRLVRPIVTPRFAPACTNALLAGLGELAHATDTPTQTHCSESDWAHEHALERFGASDAQALERFGLLRDFSVLAHGTFIATGAAAADDVALLRARGAGIAHCPLSNAYLAGAVLPVRRLLDERVRLGLGSDIAGGATPSMLRQCHEAVTAARMLDDGTDAGLPAPARGAAGSRISVVEAFWLATGGAAQVLGLPVGLLEAGRRFDAVLIDTTCTTGALRVHPELDDDRRTFEKVVRTAGQAEITDVWVDGRRVVGGSSRAMHETGR